MEALNLRIAPGATVVAERMASYLRLMGLNARLRSAPPVVRVCVSLPNSTAANDDVAVVSVEVTEDACRLIEPHELRSAALSWQEAIAAIGRLADREPPRLLRAG